MSVVLNIAEGAAKRGPRELRRYLDIALGSLSELTCALQLARDLEFLSIREWMSSTHYEIVRARTCGNSTEPLGRTINACARSPLPPYRRTALPPYRPYRPYRLYRHTATAERGSRPY